MGQDLKEILISIEMESCGTQTKIFIFGFSNFISMPKILYIYYCFSVQKCFLEK